MKKIAALVAATFCLLAFVPAVAGAERWGWSELAAQSWKEAWTKLTDAEDGSHGAGQPQPVAVLAVPLDPRTVRAPGALAPVLPMVDDALDSLRHAVSGDRQLAETLAARGYQTSQIVGASRLADGTVAVLVRNSV